MHGLTRAQNNRLLISAVKEDVADVKADTAQIPSIKQDTAQIEGLVQQIGLLRLQLDSGPMNDAKARHLQMFLDQSTSYAETVIDAIEDEEYHVQPSKALASELSNNNRDFATANINATSSNHDIPVQAGSQLSTAKGTSDQSGTLTNTVEEKEEFYVQSSRNSPSGLFGENWDVPIADAGVAGSYHDSATRPSSQLPAAGHIPDQTTSTTRASYQPAIAEADKELLQQTPARPEPPIIDPSLKKVRLLLRDEYKIGKAEALRNKMAVKQQKKLNEALEVAIRGKKTLVNRLRPRSTWFSEDIGSHDEIKDLLDRGADPNYSSLGSSFSTLEMCNAKRLEVLNLLLMRGATFSNFSSSRWVLMAARSGWTTLVENFLDSGLSLSTRDEVLNAAASVGQSGVVKMLLEYGDFSVSQYGKDAAARQATLFSHFETLKLLLEHGASADQHTFFRAASAGREDILKVLLDRGFSIPREYEGTPFEQAISNSHLIQ